MNKDKKVFDVKIDVTEYLDSYELGELSYRNHNLQTIRVYTYSANDAAKLALVQCVLDWSTVNEGDYCIDFGEDEYTKTINKYAELKEDKSSFCYDDDSMTVSCFLNDNEELVYTDSNEYIQWTKDETKAFCRYEFELFAIVELLSIDLKEIKL